MSQFKQYLRESIQQALNEQGIDFRAGERPNPATDSRPADYVPLDPDHGGGMDMGPFIDGDAWADWVEKQPGMGGRPSQREIDAYDRAIRRARNSREWDARNPQIWM